MHQEESVSVLSKNYRTNTASLLAVNGLNDLDRVIKLEIVREHKQDDSMILFYRKPEQMKDRTLKLTDLALVYCAAFFGSVGRLSRAIMNCNWALERKPDWTKALFYRGVFKYLMSSYDLSSRDFSLAINTDEQCFLAHYHRALCKEALKNWNGAFQDYEATVRLAPLCQQTGMAIHQRAFVNMGLLQACKIRNYSVALDYFEQANENYVSTEQTEQEEEDDIRFVNIPVWPELLQSIGLCQHRLGQFEKAESTLRMLTIRHPELTWAHVSRANALMDYGGHLITDSPLKHKTVWGRALEEYQFAVQLDNTDVNALVGLAICLQASGQLKDALQVITQGIDILTTTGGEVSSPRPEDEQVRDSQMSSVRPMQCSSKAIGAAYECRALILLQMAQPHRALSDLTQALRLHPKQADYLVNRGTAHQRSGDLRSAMNDYRLAAKLSPGHKLANYHRGLVYLLHGQVEQAHTALDLALYEQAGSSSDYECLLPVHCDPAAWLARGLSRMLAAKHGVQSEQLLLGAYRDLVHSQELLQPNVESSLTKWPHLHFALGLVQQKRGYLEYAVQEFTKASKIIPSNPYIYRARGCCRYQMFKERLMDNYHGALEDFQLALIAAESQGVSLNL
ncbi:hypothetical protein EG68_10217 [Paragonimus skrjabini miyazakii]|uniref:Uncharacterized protein n=1 Tax=Paragonimus skrjabini miyazakii TaxID=59628 RepID=A0A8S9YAQ4_9TREM|nr:hypothetical protein EG68_10217 [Paragonimus skrjabini miyazakii]